MMDVFTFLHTAHRAQHAIEDAMEAAFGAALVSVIADRTDFDSPLDDSIKPLFEQAYERIVLPVFDIIAGANMVEGTDMEIALLGQVKDEAKEANRVFFNERVDALIEQSKQRIEMDKRRGAAPQN